MDHSLGGEATRVPGGGESLPDLSAGDVVDRYRVIRLLGRGGMGQVYEVEHVELGTRHALKIIPSELAGQGGFVERFRREATVMAQLQHPGIVHVRDFACAEGRYWLQMDLAGGVPVGEGELRAVSLADLAQVTDGKVDQAILADVLRQILEALAFAHEHGCVHRDLKPGNILLEDTPEGMAARVSDFGLVRLVGEEWLRDRLSESITGAPTAGGAEGAEVGASTHSLMGTFEYMSPEQKRGGDVDARSDLYSVGLIAARLLTGGEDVRLDLPTQVDPSLHRGWNRLARRALKAKREDRYASAREMLADVPQLGVRTKPRRGWLVALFLLAVVLAVGYGMLSRDREGSDGPPVRQETAGPAKPEPPPTKSAGPEKAEGWPFSALEASRRQKEAEKAMPLPKGWTREAKRVKVVSPAGERDLEIDYYTNTIGMKLVVVPPGDCVMGGVRYRRSVSLKHAVRITKSFYMGAHEVTNAQYALCKPDHDSRDTIHDHPLDKPSQPVIEVSWKAAQAFCAWLTAKEKVRYRLPTEAEWEYACRAGSGALYPWGNSPDPKRLNYRDEASKLGSHDKGSDGFPATSPAGSFAPNAFGLYDMVGNVSEWCHDWRDRDRGYYKRSPFRDPQGPPSGEQKINRGGSWFVKAQFCTSNCRGWDRPDHAGIDNGLRVVCCPTEKVEPTATGGAASSAPPASSGKPPEAVAPATRSEEVLGKGPIRVFTTAGPGFAGSSMYWLYSARSKEKRRDLTLWQGNVSVSVPLDQLQEARFNWGYSAKGRKYSRREAGYVVIKLVGGGAIEGACFTGRRYTMLGEGRTTYSIALAKIKRIEIRHGSEDARRLSRSRRNLKNKVFWRITPNEGPECLGTDLEREFIRRYRDLRVSRGGVSVDVAFADVQEAALSWEKPPEGSRSRYPNAAGARVTLRSGARIDGKVYRTAPFTRIYWVSPEGFRMHVMITDLKGIKYVGKVR